jgi:hypothetical protein
MDFVTSCVCCSNSSEKFFGNNSKSRGFSFINSLLFRGPRRPFFVRRCAETDRRAHPLSTGVSLFVRSAAGAWTCWHSVECRASPQLSLYALTAPSSSLSRRHHHHHRHHHHRRRHNSIQAFAPVLSHHSPFQPCSLFTKFNSNIVFPWCRDLCRY